MRNLKVKADCFNLISRMAAMAAACISCALVLACGTEVGNGHSGRGTSGGGTTDNKVTTPTSTAEVGTSKGATDTSTTPNQSVLPSMGGSVGDMANSGAPFDINTWAYGALFASCGSPFGDAVQGDIILATGPTLVNNIALTGSRKGLHWEILPAVSSDIFYVYSGASSFLISMADHGGALIQTTYQCAAVQQLAGQTLEGAQGTFLKRTVVLTKDAKQTTVSWYLSDAADAGGRYKLNRVLIDANSTVVTLYNVK